MLSWLEPPHRLSQPCTPLTPWLLAAYLDQHSLLLCLLLRLLPPLKSIKAVPGPRVFAYGCLQPAALRASSTGLHVLVLLTENGSLRWDQLFYSLSTALQGSQKTTLLFWQLSPLRAWSKYSRDWERG